ncbi:MAG: hypothetical protein ACI8UO_002799 [Verrucomicrobiales bacterium]|jgi:hypothetical protein
MIDHASANFVFARMEQADLTPAPDAEQRTLARRLYFDLTGLSPPPEQMKALLADRSPTAVGTLPRQKVRPFLH